MCNLFYEKVNETFEKIKRLPPLSNEPTVNSFSLQELVHRIQSACTTIGAVALGHGFQKFMTCRDKEEAEAQFTHIEAAFHATQEAVANLLSELERNDAA